MSTFTATLPLTITSFTPIATGSIGYRMTLVTKSPEVFQLAPPPPTYVLSLADLKGRGDSAELIFTLDDPAYVLIGIYFSAPGSREPVGRTDFHTIHIERSARSSLMSVVDTCAFEHAYTYAIIVQQAETGLIGLIDPVIKPDLPTMP